MKLSDIKPNFKKGPNEAMKRAQQLLPPKKHDTTAGTCFIVDGMNIAYQAYYAYAKLSYQGKSTSILYGFINILRPIMMQYQPEKIVVCWDGDKHPERLKCCPSYKTHREKNRDPKQRKRFLKQIERLRVMLYRLGIPQAFNPDMEGDDMIYWMTKKMQSIYKVIILSADKDFNQLLNWDVSIYNPRAKHGNIETVWAFDAGNYGIEVPQYKDFLCLTGDSSDDIPGHPGIGPVRAAALLNKFYTVKSYLKSNKELPGFVDKEKLRETYIRNNKMINLEYFNEKYHGKVNILYYKDKAQPQFNEPAYQEFCQKYGLKTLVFPKFLEPFKKLSQ